MQTSPKTPIKTALVIGATGSIGGEVAAALLARGWRVRGLNRDPQRAARAAVGLERLDWVKGDAMVAADVIAAAQGAQVIFHGANPPGYANWARLVPPMLESVIAAARATGARIAFPGNVYNYGPDAWPEISETSPQHPKTRKGAIRVGLEQRLAAATDEGVRSLVVRAGDFFGPVSDTSWLTEGWVKKGKPIRAITLPGPAEVTHDWAYLPDFAESFVRLIEREAEQPAHAVFNHRGHVLTGAQMAAALERVAGRKLARHNLPWLAMAAISPFVEMLREMLEMRYLWENDVLLDNTRLVSFLGEEPHTPLDQALRTALEGQGCLESARANAA
jgi:nucleoside-diphosphate-sugar epimerase